MKLERREVACDVNGVAAADNNGPRWTHKSSLLPLVNMLR